jgi:assimilatory nitrate reductase catalytic subunit
MQTLSEMPVDDFAACLPSATTAVCGYCPAGCGLTHDAAGALPAQDAFASDSAASPARRGLPLKRNAAGKLVPTDWDAALREFSGRMKEIQWRCGKGAFAYLAPAQLPLEERAFLTTLARQGLGLQHGAADLRPGVLAATRAYQQAYGHLAPPYAFADLEESDAIILIGCDLAGLHPELWARVRRNPHCPEIIVIDSRTTATAALASQCLPARPGSEALLLAGVARLLIETGAIDRDFLSDCTDGFENFAGVMQSFPLDRVAHGTGLSVDQIETLARTIAARQRVSLWWSAAQSPCAGTSGVEAAAVNLALLTGNVGRPGTGANAILGPCNVLGTLIVGGATVFTGSDLGSLEPGAGFWDWAEIRSGIEQDRIKGLWVVATNAATAWRSDHLPAELLERLEFLAVQDLSDDTPLAQAADLFLPSAGWGEKVGVFMTTERRLGAAQAVRAAPGQARPDLEIFRQIAAYRGCGAQFESWDSPAAAFAKVRDASRGTPWDITGIRDHAQLHEAAGIQWPYPEQHVDPLPDRRLYMDGTFATPSGRAQFLSEGQLSLSMASGDFSLILLTAFTGEVPASHWPQTPMFVEIHPQDAKVLGIAHRDAIVIESAAGAAKATALVSETVFPGQVLVKMRANAASSWLEALAPPDSPEALAQACAVRIRVDAA